jgi:hypothetical protein
VSRSILSIALAFVLWSALWLGINTILKRLGMMPVDESQPISDVRALALMLIGSCVSSIAAGYVAAVVSKSASALPVTVLGFLLLAVGIFVESQYWHLMPLWYHVAFLGLLIPMCLLGKRMHAVGR